MEEDVCIAAKGSDLLLLGVHHEEFRDLPFDALASVMRNRNFFDTRNFADSAKARSQGFACYLLGDRRLI